MKSLIKHLIILVFVLAGVYGVRYEAKSLKDEHSKLEADYKDWLERYESNAEYCNEIMRDLRHQKTVTLQDVQFADSCKEAQHSIGIAFFMTKFDLEDFNHSLGGKFLRFYEKHWETL